MRLSVVALLGFSVLTGSLGFQLHRVGEGMSEEVRLANAEAKEAKLILRALKEKIHLLHPPPLSLSGREATSGKEILLETVDSLVVYYFRSNCPYSSQNVPFLNALHASDVPVIGITPEKRNAAISAFARSFGTTFPLVSMATGGVVDVLPEAGVPLTVVFKGGKMQTLWIGVLNQGRQRELAREFGLRVQEVESLLQD